MTQTSQETAKFCFGRNWARYVDRQLSAERVRIARDHLLDFLKLPDLAGRTFLDIGCGSGIHSLAAWQAGAEQIISFDVDTESVATTARLWREAGRSANWTILAGSVLDVEFMAELPQADIVYSWGVLHHTGAMWEALAAAVRPLRDDGVFYVALYCSDVYLDPPPAYWLDLKQRYNRGSRLRQRWLEWQYAWRTTVRPALRAGRNPIRELRDYQRSRGMSYWTDVRDWLGGWPMEFAGIEETKRFCAGLGLELIHIRAGGGNTEYLFRKQGVANYWDDHRARQAIVPLTGPFEHRGGYSWQARLPDAFAAWADTVEQPSRSRLMLYESGVPVGFPHQPLDHIERFGTGRYAHHGNDLCFSATDNTNPNQNGHRYTACIDGL